ncbi:MAG TPA: HlyD family type I secretion periplasmic adaptor subunit [Dongiaceae bacterium]|nr:HlyD family type I secretion periplasmic adaptor subunit [Dongiaceae bacterium]
MSPEILKLRPRPDDQPGADTSNPAQRPQPAPTGAKVVKLPRRQKAEREFLPAALEIIDTPPSPVGRAVGFGIIVMAIAALVWACIGQIDIIASAPGRVIAQGRTKVVQPVETGMVSAIRVADGDHVQAGDILIELNAAQSVADRDRYTRDLLQARLNLARLQGLAAAITQPAADARPQLVNPPQEANPADIALTQTAMLAQLAQQNAKLADLDQQIVAKQAEAGQAQATIEKLQASLPMVQGQEQIRRDLKDREFGNKLAWYQANQQLIEQTHELSVEAQGKQAAFAATQALQQQRAATVAEYQVNTLQELDKVRAQASELQAELAKAQERVVQSTLKAPIDGTVQQLAVHTIGGVVTPAEPLLSVVPDQGDLVVEAMVQNKDVGFIHAGQTARVKVETFNFTRYGLIDGTVLNVTRDVVSQDDGERKSAKNNSTGETDGMGNDAQNASVYVAHIALKSDTITTEDGPTKLGPGMQVSAEIQTGRRRVIDYLLSPLVRHVDESMRER